MKHASFRNMQVWDRIEAWGLSEIQKQGLPYLSKSCFFKHLQRFKPPTQTLSLVLNMTISEVSNGRQSKKNTAVTRKRGG